MTYFSKGKAGRDPYTLTDAEVEQIKAFVAQHLPTARCDVRHNKMDPPRVLSVYVEQPGVPDKYGRKDAVLAHFHTYHHYSSFKGFQAEGEHVQKSGRRRALWRKDLGELLEAALPGMRTDSPRELARLATRRAMAAWDLDYVHCHELRHGVNASLLVYVARTLEPDPEAEVELQRVLTNIREGVSLSAAAHAVAEMWHDFDSRQPHAGEIE